MDYYRTLYRKLVRASTCNWEGLREWIIIGKIGDCGSSVFTQDKRFAIGKPLASLTLEVVRIDSLEILTFFGYFTLNRRLRLPEVYTSGGVTGTC